MTEQPDRPVLEVTVAASADTVWTALRDPDLIRRWHGWEVEELGEEIRTIYLNGVTEDPVARTLEITGGDRFTLHETPDGTTVRITQAPRGSDPDWVDYYDDITEGWWTFLQQLRFAVERHALAERRTVVLQGLLDAEAAGLGPLRAAAGAYRAVAPTGDELHGTVWARRRSQVALTVAEWGDGLLVLADQPVNPHRPHGGTMALLTTYGLDRETFDALEARWGAWWEKHRAPDPLP